MAWVKGQSGNPRGRLSEKRFADAVRLAVNEPDPVTGKKRLRLVVEKLLDAAEAGEPWAIQQIADRLDGKPVQFNENTVISKPPRDMSDAELMELIAFGLQSEEQPEPVN